MRTEGVLASAVLVVLMALGSRGNAHPDEARHFVAGLYFREHWLPPAVGAPGTATTYSRYGISYLDEADFVYWTFGKAAAIGAVVDVAPPSRCRGFRCCSTRTWSRGRFFARDDSRQRLPFSC